jgi:hypothetical protein
VLTLPLLLYRALRAATAHLALDLALQGEEPLRMVSESTPRRKFSAFRLVAVQFRRK